MENNLIMPAERMYRELEAIYESSPVSNIGDHLRTVDADEVHNLILKYQGKLTMNMEEITDYVELRLNWISTDKYFQELGGKVYLWDEADILKAFYKLIDSDFEVLSKEDEYDNFLEYIYEGKY